MAWNVFDYPEPKETIIPDVCPYCGRPFEKYAWYIDGRPACDDCMKEHIKSEYTLKDLAEALGIPFAKSEDVA